MGHGVLPASLHCSRQYYCDNIHSVMQRMHRSAAAAWSSCQETCACLCIGLTGGLQSFIWSPATSRRGQSLSLSGVKLVALQIAGQSFQAGQHQLQPQSFLHSLGEQGSAGEVPSPPRQPPAYNSMAPPLGAYTSDVASAVAANRMADAAARVPFSMVGCACGQASLCGAPLARLSDKS